MKAAKLCKIPPNTNITRKVILDLPNDILEKLNVPRGSIIDHRAHRYGLIHVKNHVFPFSINQSNIYLLPEDDDELKREVKEGFNKIYTLNKHLNSVEYKLTVEEMREVKLDISYRIDIRNKKEEVIIEKNTDIYSILGIVYSFQYHSDYKSNIIHKEKSIDREFNVIKDVIRLYTI